MPVPGPRTQARPNPGYTNPGREEPDRFNHWDRPGPVAFSGETPGTKEHTLRGNVLGAGQVRRLWRQSINYVAAQAGYSWTDNAPQPDRPIRRPGPFAITRGLRYLTRSVYARAGVDNTRNVGLHTTIEHSNASKPVTIGAGGVRNRPTIRNRLTSFGSRVPALNAPSKAAQE